MKLTNLQLAYSLAQYAATITDPAFTEFKERLLRLGQGLLDYPTGPARYKEAMDLLELGPVPAEVWPDEPPDERTAIAAFTEAKDGFAWRGTIAHRLVMLRRLRWATSMLIQATEQGVIAGHNRKLVDTGGSTTGIISSTGDNRQGRKSRPRPAKAVPLVTQQTENQL